MTALFSIRSAIPCDKPAVEQLLKAGFGDEDWFLYAFFDHIWQQHEVILACEGDCVAAMAALISCRICHADGTMQDALYLYALTTLPACRGHGYAQRLLAAACARCERVFLHAADESLQRWYTRLGWQNAMHARRIALPAGDTLPPQVNGSAYHHLRERLLVGQTHIVWDENLCTFADIIFRQEGGGLYANDRCALSVQGVQNGQYLLGEALGSVALSNALALIPCAADAPNALTLAQTIGNFPAPLHMGFDFA